LSARYLQQLGFWDLPTASMLLCRSNVPSLSVGAQKGIFRTFGDVESFATPGIPYTFTKENLQLEAYDGV
jgi:hypothetical protein